MVKVSFNAALAQKEAKKDVESLIPEEDDKDCEAVVPLRSQSRAWCWCMCLGLALMLSGVVVGGAYLYRFYNQEESGHRSTESESSKSSTGEEGQVFYCGVNYREENFMMVEEEEVEIDVETQLSPLRQLEEEIRVYEEEQVELIHVPVPDFHAGDSADIVHDFHRRLTAYLDLNLKKCYVIPLNTSIVMPPRDLLELLINVRAGTYLPQSYLVHEEMIVTERIENVSQLGYFIYNLCRGKETFRLQRRDHIPGIEKREALNCHKIRHFENKFVVETEICEY